MKLHYKIALGVTFIQTLFLLFSTVFNAERFKTSIREEFASKTDSRAQLLALKISRFIEKNDIQAAITVAKKYQTGSPITYVKVVKGKNTLLDIHTTQFVPSASESEDFSEYLKKTQNESKILDAYAEIINSSGQTIAELQIGMSFYELDETISIYYRRQILFLFFQVMLMNSFVWLLSYLITRRLTRLEKACEQVGSGNLSIAFKADTSHDEIGSLSRTFQKMTLELQTALLERDSQKEKTLSASKMSSLGEMAGGIAHEINNPLTIIIGKIELIGIKVKNGSITPEQLAVELSKIHATCQRIDRIIRGLRNFSRDGEQDPFVESNIKQIFDDTLELCRARFNNLGIDLKISVDPMITAECRTVQISQIILNLLNNSIHAVENLDKKWITLEASVKENSIMIEVTDSGSGIPKHIAEKLSQPFFTTKEIGKGTGLGLSISRGIAEQHGGSLKLDTECKNTSFKLLIPKKRNMKIAA
ncbi:MAG: HAMP domain-containing histidine kinase [Xanthomonadaceae bacterium]|nr:HAMP domain-containing histidine kinase [Xanthomonadaceae bacterium]